MFTAAIGCVAFLVWAGGDGKGTEQDAPKAKPVETARGESAKGVDVPKGAAPVLDGVMNDEEWKDAVELPSSGGSKVLAKHDGEHLYIGVRASGAGITTCAVASGDAVKVLHASAALGTAAYSKDGDGWKRTRGFEFKCKDTSTSEQAQKARGDYLEAEGWTGTPSTMGKGQTELKIALEMLGEAKAGQAREARVAVSTFGGAAVSAPPGLKDGVKGMQLQMGTAGERAEFKPEGWQVVRIGDAAQKGTGEKPAGKEPAAAK